MIMMIMINTSKTTRFYIFSFKCRKDHCRVNMNSFCIISYNKTKNNLSFETKIFIVCYSNIFTLISELLSMQILPVFLLPRSINFNLGIISKFSFFIMFEFLFFIHSYTCFLQMRNYNLKLRQVMTNELFSSKKY